ncbi:MAG: type II secretion system protein GspL, partial [Mariprofundaceae bacterium]|nr:type II secretion system protein GspL [Mariprofundaceae bacterium]
MAVTASWDGLRLELRDDTGARQAVFELAPAAVPEAVDSVGESITHALPDADIPDNSWDALTLDAVAASPAALLLPAERLLLRPFSLPVGQARFVDAAMLGQELDDQAGAEDGDWWLVWQAGRCEAGVCGLVFALPESLKASLSATALLADCAYIGPDAAVRLTACLSGRSPGENTGAVLDADADGLMLGVLDDGAWRGMRRLNLCAGRGREALAREAWVSLQAMGFAPASMPVYGHLDTAWKQAFDACHDGHEPAWQLECSDELPERHAANVAAMTVLKGVAPFNFRHGQWAVQTDWNKRIGPWKRTAVLAVAACMLLMARDAYQLSALQAKQDAARQGIEQAFHQALPGVAVIDPMLQLRQAAGGGASGDAWILLRHLGAIAKLSAKEAAFKAQNISFASGEVSLTATVPDFAAANRIRDTLASILGTRVDLLDTDLNDK